MIESIADSRLDQLNARVFELEEERRIRESLDDPRLPELMDKRLKILESVIFKTSESDRSRLFDHIYKRIEKVERDAKLECERLDILTKQTNLRVEHFKEQIQINKTVTDSLRQKLNDFKEKLKVTNVKVKAWYEEYLGKTVHANKLMMEETDRVRARVISAESQALSLQEKVGSMITTTKFHNEKIIQLEAWSENLTKKIEESISESRKIDGLIEITERV